MSEDLRRQFGDRTELLTYLQREFPAIAARGTEVSETVGGRQAAEEVLAKMAPAAYGRSRNFLDGAVTRLSAYLRYGVLSLAEVRDAAFARVEQPAAAEKLVTELGWRDYWQRVYAEIGDGIWRDREAYKTGFSASDYQPKLPAELRQGTTGLVCIDRFSTALRTTGYLHNHARMWLAAYVVHWCRVQWQAGARWFLEHLLDGDPASNNLSWQWVASTFSHKPYFFNRENLERYSHGQYCRDCPHYGSCPFEGSYEAIAQKLFPHTDLSDSRRDRSAKGSRKRRRKS
ncbi:deoxyribodipyrimidine photo-lyase [bacterium]|nr:deoxyribodipyrimidine photo-lyase [bacterium]